MSTVVDELITLLTFDADTKKAEKYVTVLNGAAKASGYLLKRFGALTAAVSGFAKLTAVSAVENYNFTKSLGRSVEEFERLSYVAKVFGSDSEAVKEWLKQWNFAIKSQGGSALDFFLQQKQSFNNIEDAAIRASVAMKSGWTESMLQMLDMPDDQIVKYFNKVEIASESSYKGLLEFNKEWNSIWYDIVNATRAAVIEVSPELTAMAKQFALWVKEMRPTIIKSIKTGILLIASSFKTIVPVLIDLTHKMGPVLKSFIDFVSDKDRVEDAAKSIRDIFAGLVVIEVASWISNIVLVIPKLITALNLLKVTLGTLSPIILAITVAIEAFKFGKWIAEVTRLDEYLGEMIGKWKWFQDFINWWDGRTDKVKGIGGYPTKEQWTNGNEKTVEQQVEYYGQGKLFEENRKNAQEMVNKLQLWANQPTPNSAKPLNVVGSVPFASVTNNITNNITMPYSNPNLVGDAVGKKTLNSLLSNQ